MRADVLHTHGLPVAPQAENDKANKAAAAAELESKKLENKLSRYLKDKAAARRTLQHMLEKVGDPQTMASTRRLVAAVASD